MVVEEFDMFLVECVVWGYFIGLGWVEYQCNQVVCGICFFEGLQNGFWFEEFIFILVIKVLQGEYDENIDYLCLVEFVGFDVVVQLYDFLLWVYQCVEEIVWK